MLVTHEDSHFSKGVLNGIFDNIVGGNKTKRVKSGVMLDLFFLYNNVSMTACFPISFDF